MYLIGNGRLLTRDPELPYVENGAVVTDGELIVEIGETAALAEKYPEAEFIDAAHGVIMPGLINAHTHSCRLLAMGLSVFDRNFSEFYEVLNGVWWRLDRNLTLHMDRMSAYAAIIDSIKNGVTTLFDHHASYFQPCGSLMTIASVVRNCGIRACLCYETCDRDGKEKCDEAISENLEFFEYADSLGSDQIKASFGLQAPFTLSNRTLQKCVSRNNGRMGFHIHACEGLHDFYDSIQKYGVRPIRRLHDMGILGGKTMLVHCINVNDEEMELIKSSNCMVVNTPQSNMLNAVGCAPILQMYRTGITLGMGTDAVTGDMLESLKAVLAIQRHESKLPNVGFEEAVSMLFDGNRSIASRFFGTELGILKAGAAADIIVMDYIPYTPFSEKNADEHIMFGMSGKQCTLNMIGGKLLMRERKLLFVDEESMNREICKTASELWDKLK